MSANRVIVDPNGRHFAADSMDRFGDDTIELILSYLMDREKRSLECVSKQWQRLIYKSTTVLDICNRDRTGSDFEIVFKYNVDTDWQRLDALLKKCTNIREIGFFHIEITGRLMDVIVDNCHRLDALLLYKSWLSPEAVSAIQRSLAPKIKRLELPKMRWSMTTKTLLEYCPNVERLVCDDFFLIADKRRDFLPNLNSVKTSIFEINYKLFADFVAKYANQLKRLELGLRVYTPLVEQSPHLVSIFKDLSSFENLLELKFDVITFETKVLAIEEELRPIGTKCRRLRRFWLKLKGFNHIDGNFWRALKTFDALVDLKLEFHSLQTSHSFADIEVKPNLKHLSLGFNLLTEDHFANIRRFVPNLQTFELRTGQGLSNTVLHSLSGLRSLRKISLTPGFSTITDSAVNELLDKCPKLTNVDFDTVFNWQIKTLDRLMPIASEGMKSFIRHYLEY